ncbi:MAG TPA: serine/threonine-protein kinase [Polyangiaceae bacterium]|jgi:serine/threonine-protein kinase|nr:serine/threonine-protein kinase [Polyangiaceae bacterium]
MNVSELPPLVGGRYRPIRKLGEGSMGFVFEVEHTTTGDRLALKVMRTPSTPLPGVVERFKREARTAARIKSEHIVRVIDADVSAELGGTLYIVMELLEGTDLDRACGGPQPPQLVVEWLRQVAHGLDKAHALGVVHRDLKPENLFLTLGDHGEPRVKILDFGVAKTLEDAPGTTQTGQLLGTPLFMSPEHARAAGDIGPAADRYALGLVAYRLLAGIDYWLPSPNVAGIIAQILYEPMDPPSVRGLDLGPAFDAWFARACHRDATQRFPTSLELVQELSRALHLLLMVPVDRASIPPEARWTLQSRPETTMAPTLQSASSPIPASPQKKHRGRYVIGSFAALSTLLLVAGFFVSQSSSTDKAGAPDESAEPRSAAVVAPAVTEMKRTAAVTETKGAMAVTETKGAAVTPPSLPPPSTTLPPPSVTADTAKATTPKSTASAEPHAVAMKATTKPSHAESPTALAKMAPPPSQKKKPRAGNDDPLADQK